MEITRLLQLAAFAALLAGLFSLLRERGLFPCECLRGLLRRSFLEIALLASMAVCMIHSAATKTTNGLDGVTSPQLYSFLVPPSSVSFPPPEPAGDYEFWPYTNAVTNLTITGIGVETNAVYLRAAWPADANLPSGRIHVFASRDLQAELWEGVATETMPTWANETTLCLPFASALGGWSSSMFFRLGLSGDTDGDGIDDVVERRVTGTDSDLADTDGDGLSDGWEWEHRQEGVDPLLCDTDGDGVSDGDEIAAGTRPDSGDSDGDGLSDAEELGVIERNPDFQWYDTSAGENLLAGIDYDTSYEVWSRDLDYPVTIGAQTYSRVTIDSNGVLYLIPPDGEDVDWSQSGGGDLGYWYDDAHTNVVVAAYWESLYALTSLTSSIRICSVPTSHCTVVEYRRMARSDWGDGTNDWATFQVVLPGDANGVVRVNYLEAMPGFLANTRPALGVLNQSVVDYADPLCCYCLQLDAEETNAISTPKSIVYHLGTGTDPTIADSDDDGLSDLDELNVHHTDPLNSDTDGDGLADGEELDYGTNPILADTDADGMPDGWEVDNHTLPCEIDDDVDGDGDGLKNIHEYGAGTLANEHDTDGDGLDDGVEAAWLEAASVDVPWFSLSNPEVVALSDLDSRLLSFHLPFTGRLAGAMVDQAVVDVNGVVYYGTAETTEDVSYSWPRSLEEDGDLRCATVAGYWTSLDLSDSSPSVIRAGSVQWEGERYFVVEFSRMAIDYGLGGEVSFQVSIPENSPDVVYVRYGMVADSRQWGTVSIGAQGGIGDEWENLPRLPVYFGETPPVLSEGDVISYHFGSGGDPLVADTDGDGLDDGVEETIGTSPRYADTDGDGLPDGWEREHCLDPLSAEGDDGADGDPDRDGLANRDECAFGANPELTDADADGLSDLREVGGMVATNLAWLALSSCTNLTPGLEENGSVAVWTLPSPVTVQNACVSNVTVDLNGVVHFNRAGTGVERGSWRESRLDGLDVVCPDAFTVAPYWSYLSLASSSPATSVIAGEAMVDGVLLYVVQYENACPYWGRGDGGDSVSWQLVFPAGDVQEMFIVYGEVVGEMDGREASIGFQSFYCVRRYSWCYHEAGAVQDGLSLALTVPTDSGPGLVDTDSDGIDDILEVQNGTSPSQSDTDGDGLDDGWESRYADHGFDPRVHNSDDPDKKTGPNDDLDGDGLANGEECEWGTNPFVRDSDGDGVDDGVEVGQNSDPGDATDHGRPNSRVGVVFHFGDPSGSMSEKYHLVVSPVGGEGEMPREFSWPNSRYDAVEPKRAALKPGWKYEVWLAHSGTDPDYHDLIRPDYDYELYFRCPDDSAHVILEDPQGLFEGDSNDEGRFAAIGKVAYLYVLTPPQLTAPVVVGVNDDDDNDNGECDRYDRGDVDNEDDLVEIRIRVAEPPGTQGKVTVELHSIQGAKLWKSGDKTDLVAIPDVLNIPATGILDETYYLEGVSHSLIYNAESLEVKVQCGSETMVTNHEFTVVRRIAEPICTDRFNGQIVNPCCAIAGDSTPLKVKVLPEGFPDSKIKWSVVTGNGSFTDDTGCNATFSATGADGDVTTVRVDVGDCPGPAPQFTLRTCTMHEVLIYPCVITAPEEDSPISELALVSMLNEVNAIYRQVGMHFSLGAPITNIVNAAWAGDGLVSKVVGAQIRNVMSNTGGIEVYFIPGSVERDEPVGAHTDYGIIVKNTANALTLAHEIGHACGWTDIYIRKDSDTPIPTALQHRVRRDWLPSDWSGGGAGGLYETGLRQYELIPRLLMYGVRSGTKADIPLGSVYGLPKVGDLGNMNVGLDIFFTTSPISQ